VSRQAQLLDAILDDPDDNNIRLVYADWLEEHGDESDRARAEFIRVQIELAKLEERDPRRPVLEEREQDLQVEHEDQWLAPFAELFRELYEMQDQFLARRHAPWVSPRWWYFVRGFLHVTMNSAAHVLELLPRFAAAGPAFFHLQAPHIPDECWAEFIESPHLGRIVSVWSFDQHGEGGAFAFALLKSPRATALADVHVQEEYIGHPSLAALAAQEHLRDRPSLSLTVTRNSVGDAGVQALAASPNMRCLTSFAAGDSQSSNEVGDAGAIALAASPHLSRLHTLDLSCTNIGPEGLRALLTSPYLPQLASLRLTHSYQHFPTTGFAAVADCPPRAALRFVDLSVSQLGDTGARSLAGCSWLASLTGLNLQCNDIGPDGAVALAASPHLGELRSLDLENDINYSSIAENEIGTEGLRALLASPSLRRLENLNLNEGAAGTINPSEALAGIEGPPLVSLQLHGNQVGSGAGVALAEAAWLARLVDLDLSETCFFDAEVEALTRSPYLTRLRFLDLSNNELTERAARALAQGPVLARLSRLSLWGNELGDAGVKALATSPHLSNLRTLSLSDNGCGAAGAQGLAASPHLGQLTSLVLHNNPIGAAGVIALAASPHLGRLTSLQLAGCQTELIGLRKLAGSSTLTRLTDLDVSGNDLGPECLDILAGSPCFARLTRLVLSRSDLGSDPDAATDRLLRSPNLWRLRTLELR
jgi:uncharacterized protein (TIGR02996 family)